MSRATYITWALASTTAVCAAQTTAGAASLTLNGGLAKLTQPESTNVYVPLGNVYRTISLTSTGNLSAINFTITGTYGGVVQTETRVGPNNNTVYTTALFDSITSVAVDAAVGTNVSVGTGTTGQTKWISYDYHKLLSDSSISAKVTGTINYSLIMTMDDVQSKIVNGLTINTYSPIAALTATNASQFATISNPCTFLAILVNSSDTTGALDMAFLQQGLN